MTRRIEVQVVGDSRSFGKAIAEASRGFRGAPGWSARRSPWKDVALYALWLVPLVALALLFDGEWWKFGLFGLAYGTCTTRASRRRRVR